MRVWRWSFVQAVSTKSLGLVVFLVLGGQAELGDLGWVAWTTMATVLAQAIFLGPLLTVALRSEGVAARGSISSSAARLGWLICAGFCLGGAVARVVFHNGELAWMLPLGGLIPLAQALGLAWEGKLKSDLAMKDFSAAAVKSALGGALVALAIGQTLSPVLGILGYQVVACALQTILIRASARLPARPDRGSLDVDERREYRAIIANSGAWLVGQRADQFAVGLCLGPVGLGLFSVAARMANAVIDLVASTSSHTIVVVASRRTEDVAGLRSWYTTLQGLGQAASATLFSALVVVAPVVVGATFHGSVDLLMMTIDLLALAGFLSTVSSLGLSFLTATSEFRGLANVHLTRAAATIAFVIAGARLDGLRGAVVALVLGELAQWPVRLRRTARAIGMTYAQTVVLEVRTLTAPAASLVLTVACALAGQYVLALLGFALGVAVLGYRALPVRRLVPA